MNETPNPAPSDPPTLAPSTFCFACGAPIDPRAEICPRCGVRQPFASGPGKDRAVAALLALLLGGLGIHKFYLGKVALGVVYIVFCWTGIPTLVAWIEAITYLHKSDEAWAAEYGGPVRRASSAGIGCLWVLALWPLVSIAIALSLIFSLIFVGSQTSRILSKVGTEIQVESPQAPPATLPTTAPASLQAPPASAAVDTAKIAGLMEKLAANPNDTATLLALANEYYAGQQYTDAANWLDKLLAIEPGNVDALLARGAVSFNLDDLPAAETAWKKVVVIDPKNLEAHYDLGFLYLNLATPDWTGVQREWETVIELDPTSQLAQTVKSHLDSLVAASLIPAPSASTP